MVGLWAEEFDGDSVDGDDDLLSSSSLTTMIEIDVVFVVVVDAVLQTFHFLVFVFKRK